MSENQITDEIFGLLSEGVSLCPCKILVGQGCGEGLAEDHVGTFISLPCTEIWLIFFLYYVWKTISFFSYYNNYLWLIDFK